LPAGRRVKKWEKEITPSSSTAEMFSARLPAATSSVRM